MERQTVPGSTSASTPAAENGLGMLTKEQLADATRFKFKEKVLELPELGGKVAIKSLTVGEREALPELQDAEGKPDASVEKLAALLAAIMAEPKMSKEELLPIMVSWPGEALDKVLIAYGEMAGTEEEAAAARKEFRGQ